MRRSLSLLIAGLLVAGCSAVSPGFTLPPIPSFNIPTIPPFALPSGLPTIPPFELPSSNPNAVMCTLITADEMGAIMGGPVSVQGGDDGSCTYTTSTFSAVVIRQEQGDLATARILLSDPQDVTVGAYPGVIGGFIGVLLYAQRAGTNLVVQGVLMTDDEAGRAQILQIGTTAAGRW